MNRIKDMTETTGWTQEDWFIEWCKDLIEAGYIKGITVKKDVMPMKVYPGLTIEKTVEKIVRNKPKQVTIEQKILGATTYKPDVIIYWEDKAKDIFFTKFLDWKTTYFYAHLAGDVWITPVDVKSPPGSSKHQSEASFRMLVRWIYQSQGIFINKSVNWPGAVIKDKKTKLFKRFKNPDPYLWMMTFTPNRYFYTDKTMDPRTISKWEPISLSQFLASKGV